MTWLAVVLRKHSEPAEADLHREYGIELADFYRGKITARALSVRLRYLPAAAALWLVTNSDKAWTQESYLIAHLVDRGVKVPVQRPADVRVAKAKSTRDQTRAARWEARQKQRDQRRAERGEG